MHLSWRLRRQPEKHQGERGQEDARQDEDVVVEGHLSPHLEVEDEVNVGLRATRVVLDVALGAGVHDVPLVAADVVVELKVRPVQELQVQLGTIVSPRTKLEVAGLHVEGEVRDVDGARGLEDGLWDPHHPAVMRHHTLSVAQLVQPRVGAREKGDRKVKESNQERK